MGDGGWEVGGRGWGRSTAFLIIKNGIFFKVLIFSK